MLILTIYKLVTDFISFKSFFVFRGVVGLVVAGAAVLWCSFSASKLFVIAMTMDSQRLLVAYPCTLLYGVFALLAIF